ncbi:uncharacterized protein LOC141721476 isoform X3 [Apium graveolens]|uniref:uncharacterized protein LOC141721476 isoform X3 n=1 Tax=Apium graveolens TaxID=4045 RepID=UPI003D7A7DB2
MDFHSFVRKDLQFLCKLNKIPANRSNVAMAEALSSLKTVKGIEKFCKSSELSVAESSVESPEKNVVTSPKTTRTGRRRQVREGYGVVQTVTPFTRRRSKVPVASANNVQTVYNTRLSTRLLKKEVEESEKKECIEALKISSYCDVVSDNDFGEVFEGKNSTDDVVVDLSLSEIDMTPEIVAQEDTRKAEVPMPIRERKAVEEVFSQKKNDYFPGSDNGGVHFTFFEGSDNVGNQFFFLEDDDNVDAAVTPSTETESLIEQLKLESSGKMNQQEISCNKESGCVYDNGKGLASQEEVNGLQVDEIEAVSEIPSEDKMAEIEKPSHDNTGFLKWSDDVGVDLCVSKTDVSTEVLAHGVKVFQMNTDNTVVETPNSEMIDAIPSISLQEEGSIDVGFSFLENEFQSESSKRVYGDSLDAQVTDLTDSKVLVLDGKGVDSSVSKIEEQSESLNRKNADKDLNSGDPTTSYMKSKVLENIGFQVDTVEAVLEMQSNDNMAGVDLTLDNKNDCLAWLDDTGVYLYLSNTDILTKVLANEGFQVAPLKPKAETQSDDSKAVVDMLHREKEDDVVVDFSLSEIDMTPEVVAQEDTEKAGVQMPICETKAVEEVFSPQKNGSDNVGVHFTFFEGSDNVGNQFSFLENDNNVDAAVTPTGSKETESLKEQLKSESSGKMNQQDISCNKESGCVYDNGKGLACQEEVNGLQVNNIEAVSEMPSEEKNDVVVNLSLSEIDMTPEVVAQEDTEKAVVQMPVCERKAVEEVFSPQKNGSDNIGVHFTFFEGSDNVGNQFSFLENDDNVDAAVTPSGGKETESLNEQLKLESSGKMNQQNISCNKELACVYDNGKELTSQDEVSGKVVASGLKKCSESYGRTESLKHIDIGDCNSSETNLFQHNASYKQSDIKRKLVSEILSCIDACEFVDQLEMPGSVEVSDDFSGEVTSVDELGYKNTLVDDPVIPEISSEATKDKKRESLASQILCASSTNEPADQSDTSDSFDSSVGFSSKVTRYHQFVSGNSLTKESRPRVESDVSFCFSGINNLRFDEREQASEVKSPFKGMLSVDTEKAGVEMPIQETTVVEQVFTPQNKGSEEVGVQTSFSERSMICNTESGGDYNNDKGLASQEDDSVKAIASDSNICSESYKITKKSFNSPGDDNSADTDFFQDNVYSKQSDRKREPGSEILSSSGVVEFADRLELADSLEGSNDFLRGLTFVDELGDKDRLADDPERSSESIASQILCGSSNKRPADQSDTSVSFDSSVGFSSKVTRYHQLVSGNSVTKESRLRVESDVSYCCSGIKTLRFDESGQASEAKSPSCFKQSGLMWPSSAPRVLLPRKAKIACGEPTLIVADHPFTQKYMSSGVRALEPTFKLNSSVSDGKENMEHNENKVEVIEEKPHKENESPVCKDWRR